MTEVRTLVLNEEEERVRDIQASILPDPNITWQTRSIKMGDLKVMVWYLGKGNNGGVRICARDYGPDLGKVLGDHVIENESDCQIDYFQQAGVTIYPTSPYYKITLILSSIQVAKGYLSTTGNFPQGMKDKATRFLAKVKTAANRKKYLEETSLEEIPFQ